MGYARYVGRVGALAVALGIGTAVAAVPGVAWADREPSETSSVDSAPTQGRDAERMMSSAGDSDTDEKSDVDVAEPATELDEPDLENLQGVDEVDVVEKRSPRVKRAAEPGLQLSSAVVADRGSGQIASEPVPAQDVVVAESVDVDTAHVVVESSGQSTGPSGPVASSPLADVPVGAVTGGVGESGVEQPTPLATTELSPGVSPFSASGSDVPVASPLVWGLLAFARREIGQRGQSSGDARVVMGDVAGAVDTNTDPEASLWVGSPGLFTSRVSGRVFGRDAERDPLTYAVSSDPSEGEVTLTGNRFVYTPSAAGRHAAAKTEVDRVDSFVITVSDGNGGVVEVPVEVRIRPANTRPVATDSVALPDMDSGVVTGRIDTSDRDGDSVTYSVSETLKGTVVVNEDGTFTYTPSAEAREAAGNRRAWPTVRRESFTVTVDDGHGGLDRVRVTVPIAASDNTGPALVQVAQGDPGAWTGRVSGRVNATDVDGDRLRYAGSTTTAKGRVTVTSTGRFIYAPTATARHAAAAENADPADRVDSFDVTITDGFGGSLVVPVTVAIAPRNAVPMILRARAAAPDRDSGTALVTISTWDRDRDDLTLSVPESTEKGSLADNGDGTFTYTPTAAARAAAAADGAPAADRVDRFEVALTDGHGGMDTAMVEVRIAPLAGTSGPNDGAPIIEAVSVGTPDPSTGVVIGAVTARGADGDELDFLGSTETDKGTVVIDGDGTFFYTPTGTARHDAAAVNAPAGDKTYSFTVIVVGISGLSTQTTVSVPISPENTAPSGFIPDWELTTDPTTGKVTGLIHGSDLDEDTLTYGGSTTTTKGSLVVGAGGRFTYTPTRAARHAAAAVNAPAAAATDVVTLTVDDGHGGTKAVPLTISITALNSEPVFTGWTGETDPLLGVVTGRLTAVDDDGDPLSYNTYYSWGSGKPIHTDDGTLVLRSDGTFTYTPSASARYRAAQPDATASDKTASWSVVVNDGHGEESKKYHFLSVPISATVLDKQAAKSHVLEGFDYPRKMVTGGDGRIYLAQVKWNDYSDWSSWNDGNPDSASIAVIDPSHGYESFTIALTHVSDISDMVIGQNGRVYVVNDGTVVEVDPTTRAESRVFDAAELADREYNRIVIGADDQIYLLDGLGDNKRVKRINLAEHYDVTYDSVLSGNIVGLVVDSAGVMYLASANEVEVLHEDATSEVHQVAIDSLSAHRIRKMYITPDDRLFLHLIDHNDGFYIQQSLNEFRPNGTLGVAIWSPQTYGIATPDPTLGADGLFYVTEIGAPDEDRLIIIDPSRSSMSSTPIGTAAPWLATTDDAGRIYAHDWDFRTIAGERRLRGIVTVISPATAGAPAADRSTCTGPRTRCRSGTPTFATSRTTSTASTSRKSSTSPVRRA